jgi:hypothetical protein
VVFLIYKLGSFYKIQKPFDNALGLNSAPVKLTRLTSVLKTPTMAHWSSNQNMGHQHVPRGSPVRLNTGTCHWARALASTAALLPDDDESWGKISAHE